jgi:hypothetical protein
MKKFVCILLMTCVVMGTAFAQQKPAAPATPAKPAAPAEAPAEAPKERKNSVALDTFQLFKGFVASNEDFFAFNLFLSYERLIVPHFSLGADLDFSFMNYKMDKDDVPGFYFSLAAEGRYYPLSNFEKFFIGTTFGLNLLALDGKTDAEDGGFVGLTVSLKTGYKLIFSNGFYVEPSLGYVLSKSSAGFDLLADIGDLLGGLGGGFSISAPPTPLGWNGGLRVGFTF